MVAPFRISLDPFFSESPFRAGSRDWSGSFCFHMLLFIKDDLSENYVAGAEDLVIDLLHSGVGLQW